MPRHYSRFANLEEKRNLKKASKFLLLTVSALILLFFFGLPLVIKFAAFLTDIRQSTTPIEKSDSTPPAPPQLKNLPESTNKSSLTIDGTAEAGATVFVFLNGTPTEIIAGEQGLFTVKLTLNSGSNVIYAQAKDVQGNQSQKTPDFLVTFDNEDPTLEITSPEDGTTFSGSKNQKITILGATDPAGTLTINDRFVSISDEGNFSFSATLSEGDNNFAIKVTDDAGNFAEKTLTLKYSP